MHIQCRLLDSTISPPSGGSTSCPAQSCRGLTRLPACTLTFCFTILLSARHLVAEPWHPSAHPSSSKGHPLALKPAVKTLPVLVPIGCSSVVFIWSPHGHALRPCLVSFLRAAGLGCR